MYIVTTTGQILSDAELCHHWKITTHSNSGFFRWINDQLLSGYIQKYK